MKACEEGDINKVKLLLKNEKINPNIQNKDGNTSLIWASYYGNTPLIWASYKGYTEIVKLLLNYENYGEKINPNIQDNFN